MTETPVLPKILRQLLKDRNISARRLARETGLPQSTVASFLIDRKQRRPDQLLMVARYFDVSLEYLLFGMEHRASLTTAGMSNGVWSGWLKVKVERACPGAELVDDISRDLVELVQRSSQKSGKSSID